MNDKVRSPGDGVSAAGKFLRAVRDCPALRARFATELFTLDDLVLLGREMGFAFDGDALQRAFRGHFVLGMAAMQIARSQAVRPGAASFPTLSNPGASPA